MDIKEKSLLKYYVSKLNEGTFDEKDVYAFLVLIRNHNKDIRWISELTDFVELRDKYKGYIKDYLFETTKRFASIGQTKAAFKIYDVFSFKEIRSGLNKVLADCQVEELTNEQVNHFVTCIISILQQINIRDENNRIIGKLFFAFSTKQVLLMAEISFAQNLFKKTNAVFPVLTAKNRYIEVKRQDKYDTPYLFADDIVDVSSQGGKLEMIMANSLD